MPAGCAIWSVFVGLLVSTSVGLFFGLYPAVRASRLDPMPARTPLNARITGGFERADYRVENIVVHPWVRGYKYNTFDPHAWMYYDVDVDRRKAATK